MPFRDGTGPEGKGAKTGRGLGDCDPKVGNNLQEDSVSVARPLGRGFRRSRGRRFWKRYSD